MGDLGIPVTFLATKKCAAVEARHVYVSLVVCVAAQPGPLVDQKMSQRSASGSYIPISSCACVCVLFFGSMLRLTPFL